MEISVKDFIFCDDIRHEEGRKLSIMGIYGDKLRIMPKSADFQKFRLPISIFIRFKSSVASKGQEFKFDIQVDFEKINLAKIEGAINFGAEKYPTLPIKRMEFDFDKSGTLSFKVSMKNKENKEVLTYEETINVVIEPIGTQATLN